MPEHLLVANRGEIAIRILRTATDGGIQSTAIYASDDHASLHTRHADHALDLGEEGVAAYLNQANLLELATSAGCDAIHPGYGFLSESPEFAQACEDRGITFVGPSADTVRLFGDKAAARALAETCDVPVLPGISRKITFEEAREFYQGLDGAGGVMLKAIGGGGGARHAAGARTSKT